LELYRSQSTSGSVTFCFAHGTLIGNLHGQEFRGGAVAQPPFAIQFPPVEHLIRVHIVTPRHSRHRCPRLQGRFHDLAPIFHTPPPLLRPCYLPVTGDLRDPYVAQLSADNLKNLPTALVITYEDNPMHDEGDEYASRLKQESVEVKVSFYPNMIHGFFLMAGELDAGKKCIDEMASALRNAFNGALQNLP
jgi:acetyl esterase/lipase